MTNNLDRMRELAGLTPAKAESSLPPKNMYQIRDTLMESAKPDFADIDDDGDKEETAKKAAADKKKKKVDEGDRPAWQKEDGTDKRDDADYDDWSYDNDEEVEESAGTFQFRIDRMGHVTIKGNGQEVYLQGDEAADFHDQIEAVRDEQMDDFLASWLDGEQVNELGKGTLGSYVKKATDSIASNVERSDYGKAINRKRHQDKAIDKLTKEEQMREWSNSVGGNVEDRGTVTTQPDGETVDLSLRRYLDAEPQNVKVVEAYNDKDLIKEYKNFKK